ncbi:hypothetical protein EVAR_71804_1 [Eumeta japonica]|uniref:PHD-type domain-containing protein n=1 Tax=Eumeta variegata TaxID=151549 RepID=A0A4C1TH87_EUMVA|nr:hypothetical protein EVAR_71804_1 [Eumeta japonica]
MAPVYLSGSCEDDASGKSRFLCTSCKKWFHPDCEEVSEEVFYKLDKNPNFNCKKCMNNPTESAATDISLREEVRNGFAEFKDSLKCFSKDIKQIEANMNNKLDDVKSGHLPN